MMDSQQSFWDERYDRPDYLFGEAPNDFIRAMVPPAAPGMTAFAPADGEGRNGVWLARLGYQVTSIDVSAHAVAKAKALAEKHSVSIDARVGDLFAPMPDDPQFDLVIVSFMHFHQPGQTRFHQMLIDRLKPGGLIVLECYHRDQMEFSSGGPKDPDMLLTRADVVRDFSLLEIILAQDVRRDLAEGPRHRGPAATVQLVARKPN